MASAFTVATNISRFRATSSSTSGTMTVPPGPLPAHVSQTVACAVRGAADIAMKVIDIGAVLVADLQQIAESIRGDEGDLTAFALDERIRSNSGAVGDLAHRLMAGVEFGKEFHDPLQKGMGWIGRRRRYLVDAHAADDVIPADEVSECAPHVDAYPDCHQRRRVNRGLDLVVSSMNLAALSRRDRVPLACQELRSA